MSSKITGSMRMVGDKSFAAMEEALRAAHCDRFAPPPPGAFTVQQYADSVPCGRTCALVAIRMLISAGKAKRAGSYRSTDVTGRAQSIPHYILTKK